MDRRNSLKKVMAFLLAVMILCGTSFDGHLRLGTDVWAGPLSPENAITFATGLSSIQKIFEIDGQYYLFGISASTSHLGIYKIVSEEQTLSLLCDITNVAPGAIKLAHYRKIGSTHRFIIQNGDSRKNGLSEKYCTISSDDMVNFSVAGLNNGFGASWYGFDVKFYDTDDYTFVTLIGQDYDPVVDGSEDRFIYMYRSADCISWTRLSGSFSVIDQSDADIYVSNPVGVGKRIVLGTYEDEDDDDYPKDIDIYYRLNTYNGSKFNEVDGVMLSWKKEEHDSYCVLGHNQNKRYELYNYGSFSYVFLDIVDFKEDTTSFSNPPFYAKSRRISLYYGDESADIGTASENKGTSIWTYSDNGVYSNRLTDIGGWLYYRYTPKTGLPAGTFIMKGIKGTDMTTKDVLSVNDYQSSEKYSVDNTLYYKITSNSDNLYYKIENGVASAISADTYINSRSLPALATPDDEYRDLNYSKLYANPLIAIFFNSTNKSLKIIYNNTIPEASIVSPLQNTTFGMKDTAIVSQISVSDADNDALTCKYYLDETLKETRTVASNTQTAQTVSFTALNMGTLSEGLHKMRFEVSDGSLTAQAAADFRVDKTPPSITNLNATSTENSITITGSASDSVAGLDAKPYNYTVTDGTNTYSSGWKAETTHIQGSLQPNRSYTAKLEARDKVLNTAQSTKTVYTKAQRPTAAASNSATTAMDISISDNNPSNTQYQIASGTKYISSGGALTTTPQWITLTNKRIRATGLTPNTSYSITVKARNGANEETLPSAAVTGTTLPDAPANLSASPDKKAITLTWSAMPNIIRYEVSADGQVESNGTSTTYIHDGLEPNTQHKYRVRAVNAGGAGAWSGILTTATLPDPPGIPANLRAVPAQREVTLEWDAVEGAASYDIEADGEIVGSTAEITYTHTGLQPNTPHTYRVRAVNRGGDGEWCDLLNADTLPEPPEIPGAFEIADRTKDTITLKWNAAERAEVYDIEADGAIIDSTTEAAYTHTGLAADTEHVYRVRARNRGGVSEWTAEAVIGTLPEKPGIPNNLTATAGINEIILSWDVAERATEYDIEADGAIIATITGTSFTHEGLAPDTKHTYRIKARNIGGESDYSAMVTAYTLSDTTGMALANVAAVVTNTSITLMWDAVASDTEYDVEVDGEIKDNGKNTTYIHSGLQPVTSHTYKIRPKKGEEKGPWCAVLAISTLPNAPDAPDNIRAVVTNTTIQLMWDPEEGAAGYDIEIDGSQVESTTDTTFIHKDLIPGTEHSYRIRAKNIGGAAAWSEAIVKSTIKPTYMIEAEAGEEYHIALTAMGMQEFSGRKIMLKYDPDEVELVDLCEATREIELENGKIPGTGIVISHEDGMIVLEVDKQIEPGKAWTGVMDTILIKAKVDGQISLDYIVE